MFVVFFVSPRIPVFFFFFSSIARFLFFPFNDREVKRNIQQIFRRTETHAALLAVELKRRRTYLVSRDVSRSNVLCFLDNLAIFISARVLTLARTCFSFTRALRCGSQRRNYIFCSRHRRRKSEKNRRGHTPMHARSYIGSDPRNLSCGI